MADDLREGLDASEELWRRVHDKQWVADSATGEKRISTAAFTDPELSVDRARIRQANGYDHKITQGDSPVVASFTVGAAIEVGQQVVSDALPDNDAHALVLGPKTGAVKRALQKASTPLL